MEDSVAAVCVNELAAEGQRHAVHGEEVGGNRRRCNRRRRWDKGGGGGRLCGGRSRRQRHAVYGE